MHWWNLIYIIDIEMRLPGTYVLIHEANIKLDMSNRVDEPATDPISHYFDISTLGLTQIKLLRISFCAKHLWKSGIYITDRTVLSKYKMHTALFEYRNNSTSQNNLFAQYLFCI